MPAGGSGGFALGTLLPGWHEVKATKAPDELRADDDHEAVVLAAEHVADGRFETVGHAQHHRAAIGGRHADVFDFEAMRASSWK